MPLGGIRPELIQLVSILILFVIGFFVAMRLGFRQGLGGTLPAPEDTSDTVSGQLSVWQRLADSCSHLAGKLFVIGLIILLVWFFWPQLVGKFVTTANQSQLSSSSVGTQPLPAPAPTDTEPSAIQPAEYVEESISSWQVYENSEYGFSIRYPKQWKIRPADEKEIKSLTSALLTIEFFDVTNSQFFIRLHLEENPDMKLATSFASTHPQHGGDRTPFNLHGVRSVKYLTQLPKSRQNRLTIYAPTKDNKQIIVLAAYSPIDIDEFSADLTRFERILTTLIPQTDLAGEDDLE